jgi:hypothetical protein
MGWGGLFLTAQLVLAAFGLFLFGYVLVRWHGRHTDEWRNESHPPSTGDPYISGSPPGEGRRDDSWV